MESQTVVIPVPDMDGALTFFVETLGFRVDQIWPADDPRVAQISGHGARLELVRVGADRAPPGPLPPLQPTREIGRLRAARWGTGRAGMQYRDLLPSRQGGHLIASHIRIPGAGPVSDWVHFHDVDAQLIFCLRGRARVVYEDQGPAFDLLPGDCILQPPTIRHRVLASYDDLEVIELSRPAAHLTAADPERELPTATIDPTRTYRGQRFVHSRAADADWVHRDGLAQRQTRIAEATQARMDVGMARGRGRLEVGAMGSLVFLFVIEGSIHLDADRLVRGDGAALPGPVPLHCDGTLLHVSMPC